MTIGLKVYRNVFFSAWLDIHLYTPNLCIHIKRYYFFDAQKIIMMRFHFISSACNKFAFSFPHSDIWNCDGSFWHRRALLRCGRTPTPV